MKTNVLKFQPKSIKFKSFLIVLTLLLANNFTFAQNQAYLIHEDRVKPDKYQEYVEISKEFKALCEQHNFSESWNVAQMDGLVFLMISPIDNFADLDKNPMSDLSKKVGEDKFRSYFERYDQCYNEHGSYISILNKELSYMPEGLSVTQEGEDFREWIFMDVPAKNVSKVKEKMKAIKTLFENKKSKLYYRIYQNGFGHVGDRFVVVISSKSELDNAQKGEDNNKLLGEENRHYFTELYSLLSSYKSVLGRMRPDLSYIKK